MDRDGGLGLFHSPAVQPVSGAPAFQSKVRSRLVPHTQIATPPRCNRSSFYDKQRLNETRNLKCPYTDCHYVWCKSCQQEIAPWSPDHPCDDGSSALKRLVEERNWKYCPSESIPSSSSWILVREDDSTACRTPCEKISGCNLVSVSEGRQSGRTSR